MVKLIGLLPLLLLIGCTGFAYEEKIFNNYYLIGVDTKENISVSLKLESGGFVGRILRVTQYAIVSDSLIVARSVDTANKSVYYILDMKKDFDIAKTENVVIGPIDSENFISWAKNYDIKFVSVLD